jgi:hypothetical protein
MGQIKKKKPIGGGIASLGRSFERIAYGYGMTPDYAELVLEKEFERLHNGTSFNNYVLVETWEDLRADPKYKEMADYDLKLMCLPKLQEIAGIAEALPKDWAAEYTKLVETRMKKNYSGSIKVISSRISRVLKKQKKEYSQWKKVKKLLLKER